MRIDASIPEIEIPYHTDALRVRRPDREVNAIDFPDFAQVRAKFFVKLMMTSFREEMQIDLAHEGTVAIRIAHRFFRAAPVRQAHRVVAVAFPVRQDGLEETIVMQTIGGKFLIARDDAQFLRVRTKDAHDQVLAHTMRPKNAKRIVMRAGQKGVHFINGRADDFEIAHARSGILVRTTVDENSGCVARDHCDNSPPAVLLRR